jgi:hypothetical protein
MTHGIFSLWDLFPAGSFYKASGEQIVAWKAAQKQLAAMSKMPDERRETHAVHMDRLQRHNLFSSANVCVRRGEFDPDEVTAIVSLIFHDLMR